MWRPATVRGPSDYADEVKRRLTETPQGGSSKRFRGIDTGSCKSLRGNDLTSVRRARYTAQRGSDDGLTWHRHPLRTPSGRAVDAPWTGHRSSDATGLVGASSERHGLKCAERGRGAGSAEGLTPPTGGRTPAADRDPGRPAVRSREPRKPARGAGGKPSATQRRKALERVNPKGASGERAANPRPGATDSRGEQSPGAGHGRRGWHFGAGRRDGPGNGRRATGVERRSGSAGGESSEGGNPMSVTGPKGPEGRGRRNAARGRKTL